MSKKAPETIELFKQQVLNILLVFISFISSTALLSIYFRDYRNEITPFFALQVFIVLTLCVLAFYRKRLASQYKILIVVISVFLVFLIAIFQKGFLASAKYYVIFLPALLSFIQSFKQASIIFFMLYTYYLVMGVLHVQHILAPNEYSELLSRSSFWITDGLLLFFCGFGLLLIGKQHYQSLQSKIATILEKNKMLESSEERNQKLILSFPDMIMVSDLEGHIVYANEHLMNRTGIREEDFLNPNRKPHIHPDDLPIVKEALDCLLNSDQLKSDTITNRFIDAKGNTHWFSGTMTKLFLEDEILIQTVSRDITQQKEIELELQQHRENLEILVKEKTEALENNNEEIKATVEELYEKNRIINDQNKQLHKTLQHLKETQSQLLHAEKMASLGVITAGVAHEMNNPLNYITGAYQGLVDFIKEKNEENDPRVKIILNGIGSGLERASAIVQSLNQFSRNTKDYKELCNIPAILDNSITILASQCKDRIQIHKEYPNDLPPVNGNVGELHQVFLNLLTNSMQAIEKKGSISVSASASDEEMLIRITDTGSGIDPSILEKITEPFFTTKAPGQGTGLGLSISYNIIQRHGGNLAFQSEPGRGTEAMVSLPGIE